MTAGRKVGLAVLAHGVASYFSFGLVTIIQGWTVEPVVLLGAPVLLPLSVVHATADGIRDPLFFAVTSAYSAAFLVTWFIIYRRWCRGDRAGFPILPVIPPDEPGPPG